MSVSFDTNVLVYATATLPSSKSVRAPRAHCSRDAGGIERIAAAEPG